MTANPLKSVKTEAPAKRTAREWCDIGNDRLAGRIPYKDGKYEERKHLRWIVDNGQPRLIHL